MQATDIESIGRIVDIIVKVIQDLEWVHLYSWDVIKANITTWGTYEGIWDRAGKEDFKEPQESVSLLSRIFTAYCLWR